MALWVQPKNGVVYDRDFACLKLNPHGENLIQCTSITFFFFTAKLQC